MRLISRWNRGSEWYRQLFVGCEPILGESSTSYTSYPHTSGVPERIQEVVPDAKLAYLVRDPVERLVSHYQHVRGLGRERRSLAGILASPHVHDSMYVTRSRYWLQLSQYLACFSERQMTVISFTDLRSKRAETLAEVFAFLGVEPASPDQTGSSFTTRAHRFPLMEALGHVFTEPMLYRAANEWRGARRRLASVQRRQRPAPELAATTLERLQDLFAGDADHLRRFTGGTSPTGRPEVGDR